MNLFDNFRQYILIIVITVALGYFLGITVSTVVDYRLKDAIINLPKPKNNIIIKLKDEEIKLLKDKKNIKVEKKKNKTKKKDKKKNKTKKKDKRNKDKKKKEQIIENFVTPFDNITNLESLPGPPDITAKIQDPWQFRSRGKVDPNVKNYNNLYIKSNKKIIKQKDKYKASNEEDADQTFEPIISKKLQKGKVCEIRQN